jgi:hypothetical protein
LILGRLDDVKVVEGTGGRQGVENKKNREKKKRRQEERKEERERVGVGRRDYVVMCTEKSRGKGVSKKVRVQWLKGVYNTNM